MKLIKKQYNKLIRGHQHGALSNSINKQKLKADNLKRQREFHKTRLRNKKVLLFEKNFIFLNYKEFIKFKTFLIYIDKKYNLKIDFTFFNETKSNNFDATNQQINEFQILNHNFIKLLNNSDGKMFALLTKLKIFKKNNKFITNLDYKKTSIEFPTEHLMDLVGLTNQTDVLAYLNRHLTMIILSTNLDVFNDEIVRQLLMILNNKHEKINKMVQEYI